MFRPPIGKPVVERPRADALGADAAAVASAHAASRSFTLVEVVVAIALMLLTMGAMLMAFMSAQRSANSARTFLEALSVGREELELTAGLSYAAISNFGPVPITNGRLAQIAGRKTVTVVTSPGGTNGNYKTVQVTISWTNAASTAGASLTLDSAVCEE